MLSWQKCRYITNANIVVCVWKQLIETQDDPLNVRVVGNYRCSLVPTIELTHPHTHHTSADSTCDHQSRCSKRSGNSRIYDLSMVMLGDNCTGWQREAEILELVAGKSYQKLLQWLCDTDLSHL